MREAESWFLIVLIAKPLSNPQIVNPSGMVGRVFLKQSICV